MKAVPSLFLLTCIALASLCQSECMAGQPDLDSHRIASSSASVVYHSSGSAAAKTATDSFYVYGGPGTADGQFQTLPGWPGGAPDPQGWVGVDVSETTPHWHASSVNSSSTGDGNPQGFTGSIGNHGIISQHDGFDYVGYGDDWDDWLEFGFDPAAVDPGFDAAVDTSRVRITCEYKHFLEEGFDFLNFEWNKAGAFQSLFIQDGTSYNDTTGYYEKRDFDSDEYGGIVYGPDDYSGLSIGPGGTIIGIKLRIRVTTDGGWSDEDGLLGSNGMGAAALDNIRVYVNGDLVSLADFEHIVPKDDLGEGGTENHNIGAGPGTSGWRPTPSIFVGDFASIYGQFQDIDPCRDNITPAFCFINDGVSPRNCPSCPIAPAVSSTWSYGIPGGYVVEYNGGLAGSDYALNNYILSPTIHLDLVGPADDVANGGLVLGFTRYTHLPFNNGIFAFWQVRSGVGSGWSTWKDNGHVYNSETPKWENQVIDVSHLIASDAEMVQIGLGVRDMAEVFFVPGNDATPSPLYDNVYLKKYRIGGPVMSARSIDLASDCFPVDGSLTGSCRFDASLSNSNFALVPGDSIVVTIVPGIPGSELVDPAAGGVMYVAHLANPEFDTERAAALAAMVGISTSTDPHTGWPIYSYEVLGQPARDSFGNPVDGRYFWDLLDGSSNGLPHIATELGWIFPGDVIHYRFESSDTTGGHSVLPEDITGFGDFAPSSAYPRAFSMRALPTMVNGEHPRLLFWNDAGHGPGESEYLYAFRQLCLVEGQNMDTYTTKAASSGLSNGLGSAGFHGANAQQLAGYDILIYALGSLHGFAISDGSGNYPNDMANDLTVLTDWANADADRFHVYFGDDFSNSMISQGSATQSYLNQILGVDFLDRDVGPSIGGQVTPTIAPTGSGSGAFGFDHVVLGGCPTMNDFDHIAPYAGGAVAAHQFLDLNFNPYPIPVAGSVEWLRTDGNGKRKHTVVFPYDLSTVQRSVEQPVLGIGARAALLQQVLSAFGISTCSVAVEQPDIPNSNLEFYVNQNHPNPFNPSTRISFSLAQRGDVRVTLYNVRGERVALLMDEVRDAGPGFVDWHGLDNRGAEVASGIYLYKVEAAGTEVIKKMALIR